MTIRARFNGTVIVPDEPVDLPVNMASELEVKRTNGSSPEVAAAVEAVRDPADTAGRLAALSEFVAHAVEGADIPDERLRRERLYDDSGRRMRSWMRTSWCVSATRAIPSSRYVNWPCSACPGVTCVEPADVR